MRSSNNIIAWAMRNFRITFLIVGCLFLFGVFGLIHIPKQEFPEFTIRQGVVVGVYPGATSEEVEEQLARPLEQFPSLRNKCWKSANYKTNTQFYTQ